MVIPSSFRDTNIPDNYNQLFESINEFCKNIKISLVLTLGRLYAIPSYERKSPKKIALPKYLTVLHFLKHKEGGYTGL